MLTGFAIHTLVPLHVRSMCVRTAAADDCINTSCDDHAHHPHMLHTHVWSSNSAWSLLFDNDARHDQSVETQSSNWDDDARAHTLYNTKIRCSGTTDRHTCVCFRRRHPYASCTIIATTESVTKSRVCRGNLYANYITTSQEAQTLVSGFCG